MCWQEVLFLACSCSLHPQQRRLLWFVWVWISANELILQHVDVSGIWVQFVPKLIFAVSRIQRERLLIQQYLQYEFKLFLSLLRIVCVSDELLLRLPCDVFKPILSISTVLSAFVSVPDLYVSRCVLCTGQLPTEARNVWSLVDSD